MNYDWLRDVVRFFLDGLTIRQFIHMLIILIILIIIMPTSVKEWVNAHNPEILPPYWMYYTLLFCISYVARGVLSLLKEKGVSINESRAAANKKRKVRAVVSSLTEEQLAFFILPMHEREQLVITKKVCHQISELLELGVLLPNPLDWGSGYIAFHIADEYWQELTLRWDPERSAIRADI